MKGIIIAVDFDGTCVTHEYPKMGRTLELAVDTLRELARNHRIILLTMRDGNQLVDAENWFRENRIDLWASNRNPDQDEWTESRKVYANVYIDDAALGCPLTCSGAVELRDHVDWARVRRMLKERGLLECTGP